MSTDGSTPEADSCPYQDPSLLTSVYDRLEQFESLMTSRDAAKHKAEARDQFYQRAIQHKKQRLSLHQAIDPRETRFYLLTNSNMLQAIRSLVDEIAFTLSAFLDYLVLPQSGLIGPLRPGYFEISLENIEDGFVKPPTIHLVLFEYVLYSLLPYSSFLQYEAMDVADLLPKTIEAYDVIVDGDTHTVVPQSLFTDEELRQTIVRSKELRQIMKDRDLVITEDVYHEWRTFLKRVVRGLTLFVSPRATAETYLQTIRQLQVQTWIVRGIEMNREMKLRNAMFWIITAGTDWLEKRELDLYDISFAIQLLLGESGITYRGAIMTQAKSKLPVAIEPLRVFALEQNLLASVQTLETLQRILNYILTQPELIGWIDERLNMFAQL